MKYPIKRVRPKIQIFKDNAMFCHDSYHGQFNLKLGICHFNLLLQVKQAGTLFFMILGQHMRKGTVRTLCGPMLLEAKQKCCGLASWWAMNDYPSAILATLQTGGSHLPNCYYFCSLISARTNCFFFHGRQKTTPILIIIVSQIFQNHSNKSAETKKTIKI